MDETNTNTNTTTSRSNLPVILAIIAILIIGGVIFVANQKQKSTPNDAMMTNKATTMVMSPSVSPSTTESDKMASDSTMTDKQGAITVEGGMFYFKPNEIKVKKGQKVTINFVNKEGMHDFVIDELNVKSKLIKSGETTTVEFTPDKTGTFEFYCSVGNHRQMGMKGNLIVE